MRREFYYQLAEKSIAGECLSRDEAKVILSSEEIELLPLLNAAYEVRKKFVGNSVTIHIINNVQNGHCGEDCQYCAQSRSSKAEIEVYPLKSDEEILAEAKDAYERGAFRYCMVFSGKSPSLARIKHLVNLIRKIKSLYPIQVCVSAGIIDYEKAKLLKQAGLDRLNHNLNTSRSFYSKICTTHAYSDRMNTLKAARKAGLQICSGVIVGMGENVDDIIEMAETLRNIKADSIPINFFIPIPGIGLNKKPDLTPEYCLRILCFFRFINPTSEIRIAAGRELYLRGMQAFALYPANSLFLAGYLNATGDSCRKTLQMIKDAGFTIASDRSLDELIKKEEDNALRQITSAGNEISLKGIEELRPHHILDSSKKER